MATELGLHLQAFNNRVKVMNQTNAKDLTLSAKDARNIHADIFDMLTKIAELAEAKAEQQKADVIQVNMDGGNF